MPKYMIAASYTAEGLKGLLRDGGTGRRAAIEKALVPVGGKIEAFYFSFGDTDAILITDLPDNASAAAVALATSGLGFVRTRTTVLLTPEEVDQAAQKSVAYRPPGV